MSKLTKINNFDKLLIVCLVLTTILNPLTGQYVLLGINYVLDMSMLYGPSVIAAPLAYVIGYLVYKSAPRKLNVPKKGSKTSKAGSFIATR